MPEISDSLNRIEHSLKKLAVTPAKIPFRVPQFVASIVASLNSRLDTNRLSQATKDYIKFLDRLEKVPVLFGKLTPEREEQNNVCRQALLTGKHIKKLLTDSPKHADVCHTLAYKVAALKYRIETENGGLCPGIVDQALLNQLSDAALKWKKKSPLMTRKDLNTAELDKLATAASHTKFSKILLADRALQNKFFTWALRDNNGVKQFIEFPSTAQRLKSAFLAARIGRFGGTMLKMQKERVSSSSDATLKILTLPFFIDNKMTDVSILDESREVELTGWRLTIKEVIDIFGAKNKRIGDVEFFGTRGITNWNAHKLGSWNPTTGTYDLIDLTLDNWWEQLPILEELSKDELEARYDIKLKEGEWLACAKSTRTTTGLDLDLRHGYIEVSLPVEGGKYRVFPFGNFPAEFPDGVWQLLGYLVNTVPGVVSYPDENTYYSQRQQASYPFTLVVEKGLQLMKRVQKEMIMSRFGYKVFQFGGENCAYWAQSVLHFVEETLPNFFRMPMIESDPINPFLNRLFRMFRATPRNQQLTVIKLVEEIFGASRGRVVFELGQKTFKSHKNSAVYDEQHIYQPGYLHHLIEQEELKGCISYGH